MVAAVAAVVAVAQRGGGNSDDGHGPGDAGTGSRIATTRASRDRRLRGDGRLQRLQREPPRAIFGGRCGLRVRVRPLRSGADSHDDDEEEEPPLTTTFDIGAIDRPPRRHRENMIAADEGFSSTGRRT